MRGTQTRQTRVHGPVQSSAAVVLVGSLAVSLGMASPAGAAPETRRQATPKPATPRVAAPVLTPAAASTTPSATATVAEAAPPQYIVSSGDTVSGIAARFGLSTQAVLDLNGLSSDSLIFPDQVLRLAADPASHAPAAPAPQPAAAGGLEYTIQAGDTIGAVAERYGLPVQDVLDANGLSWTSIIYPGQVVTVPLGGMDVAVAAIAPPAPLSPPVTAPEPSASAPVASVATDQTPLSEGMRANAATIVAVGRELGVSDRGLIIALAAAMQESSLLNIEHGDRDSVGLFQQRPSMGWGTPEQIIDPGYAARAFFGGADSPTPGWTPGLLDISGWESMTVAQAAQAVQISAYPDAYARWEGPATAWLAELG
ncbi:LysM peptidoglycan-binding domain-containing protein [Compostimonas suwonensis]|uniref:LysM repeat protein n=1 Tax=Compostimonas suwonensis TaxID=1048394 RepID=A0A2M9BAZ1_9MICO|nr:LysM domain-containing protein [Compostimonas suwonensis]PJJ55105.1 LysM repeat protein [Compostimonas suwonensis]